MAQEIGLQELMFQVKKELLAQAPDDPVPRFYVEGVELKPDVAVRKEARAGVKIHVVDVGGGGSHATTQRFKVSLSPLYSCEEMRSLLEQDPAIGARLEDAATDGLVKGGTFDGQ